MQGYIYTVYSTYANICLISEGCIAYSVIMIGPKSAYIQQTKVPEPYMAYKCRCIALHMSPSAIIVGYYPLHIDLAHHDPASFTRTNQLRYRYTVYLCDARRVQWELPSVTLRLVLAGLRAMQQNASACLNMEILKDVAIMQPRNAQYIGI